MTGDGASAHGRGPRPVSLYTTLRAFALTALVTFLIGALDVLGLHSNIENLSDRMAQRVLAPVYRKTAGQKNITVVLIDRRFLDNTRKRQGWPLPVYFFLHSVLDPIVNAHPAAVFIDVSFTDMPRPLSAGNPPQIKESLEALADGIRTDSRQTPIFVADDIGTPVATDEEGNCPVDGIDPATVHNRRTTSAFFIDRAFAPVPDNTAHLELVAANWTGSDAEYPTGSMIVSAPSSCNSAIRSLDEAQENPRTATEAGYLVTPAIALARSLCDSHVTLQGDVKYQELCPQIRRIAAPQRDGYGLYFVAPSIRDPIKLRWATHQSKAMRDQFGSAAGADHCLAQFRNGLVREEIIQVTDGFLPGLVSWIYPRGIERHCAYIDTISAADLRERANAPHDSKVPPGIADTFLKNRIVLVGTDLPYVPDVTQSPVNEQMPGVYLHATALENLLTSGANYPRALGSWGRLLAILVESALVVLLGLAAKALLDWLDRQRLLPGRDSVMGVATFVALWIWFAFAIFVAALLFSTLFGWLGQTIYFGSAIYVALAAIVVMSEEMRHDYFEGKAIHRSRKT